jgi:hypothetical protein
MTVEEVGGGVRSAVRWCDEVTDGGGGRRSSHGGRCCRADELVTTRTKMVEGAHVRRRMWNHTLTLTCDGSGTAHYISLS